MSWNKKDLDLRNLENDSDNDFVTKEIIKPSQKESSIGCQ